MFNLGRSRPKKDPDEVGSSRIKFTVFRKNPDGSRGTNLGEIFAESDRIAYLRSRVWFSVLTAEIIVVKTSTLPNKSAKIVKGGLPEEPGVVDDDVE